MSTVEEKRKCIRYNLNATSEITFQDDGKTCQGDIRDISVGGFFIELDNRLSPTDNNRLVEFHIYADICSTKTIVIGDGRIVRVTAEGIGIFFEVITDEQKKQLHKIISELRHLMNE
ncbi:MAG: PilZ domain-containing protein [Methylococcales bacterium]|jgi:hypothetical protein|nr:PilZ domain-containing protein [Methylococcales bacterium]MBT7408457.1 PilZ domain-containing protein [Methylococcales bacterium]